MKHIAIGENHLYSKAYAKGNKYVAKGIIVYVLKDYKAYKLQKAHPQKLMVNRIGLTVSKKIGGAVVRSRVKRILRAGLRQVEKENNIAKGYFMSRRDFAFTRKSYANVVFFIDYYKIFHIIFFPLLMVFKLLSTLAKNSG